MEKGELVYASPPCPPTRRIFSIIGWVFVLALIPIVVLTRNFQAATSKEIIAIALLVCCVIFGATLLIQQFMYPHFKIYTNGFTLIAFHCTPFERCENIERRFIFREYQFIKWSKVLAFDRFGYTNKTPSIVIFIENGRGKKEIEEIVMYHPRKDVIEALIRELKGHGVPDIPIVCQKCGKKPYASLPYCTNCRAPRVPFSHKENEENITTPQSLSKK
ncbi:MAG: hypothetical protein QXJ27_04900 [Thermoplasmata archaeon]